LIDARERQAEIPGSKGPGKCDKRTV
jgi:hypothetical protein